MTKHNTTPRPPGFGKARVEKWDRKGELLDQKHNVQENAAKPAAGGGADGAEIPIKSPS